MNSMSSTQRQWFTVVTPQNISANTQRSKKDEFCSPSTASVSRIGNKWWVNRVKVADIDQGKGIGRALVRMLQVSLVENHNPSEGNLVVQVCPGGYNTAPEVQRDFYLSCGFRMVKDFPELTMEWSWCPQDSTKSNTETTRSESQAG